MISDGSLWERERTSSGSLRQGKKWELIGRKRRHQKETVGAPEWLTQLSI